jgi:hypothetical protein
VPDEPYSLSLEARGVTVGAYQPPLPVYAWVQTPNRLVRVDAVALESTADAVLVQWGAAGSQRQCWVWRTAVKHRGPPS